MESPYSGLTRRAYWRTGVAERHPLAVGDIYRKKFSIRPGERIATAGSCFAQHIASRLRQNGFQVLDTEPPPRGLNIDTARLFGYNLYSARYGNVYTLRQMLQLVQECRGMRTPAEVIWEKNGRFYDALRPSIEPEGLAAADWVSSHRRQHLERVNLLFQRTTLFIFTFGLTETWEHKTDGTVYPTAPGSIAGSYEPESYRFKNLDYTENLNDFLMLRDMLREYNGLMRFILTVSPVPLTATASGEHVLPATTYSKSVLRAVAGYLAQNYEDIDYFPSYEIVAGAPTRGVFYENNLRNVATAGVDVVMQSFFEQHGSADVTMGAPVTTQGEQEASSNFRTDSASLASQKVYCDEEVLEAFAH